MTFMTLNDLKVIGGQTPHGGFFELFTPKSGWVNGGSPYGPPWLVGATVFTLERRQLDRGCYRLYLKKIKFDNFLLRPPKVGGHIWVKA